ncbi:MAG: hypothetical protein AVDCRST_MAG39-1784 [uncultured Sphingomonadaceae bacterium]|uniref:Mobile element protein n=1 Tax=uncultured Sphingomonadaceae bacterium TaxID=169976 RepID=A0A6J4SX45_9SPHN|nr:MAG: hypothetical protein AVDCRST_MAG39-1784 [uncultured Sphingomonadaceae bacterium]
MVEHGRYGDKKYARELTDGDRAVLDRLERWDADRDRCRAERAREVWFTPGD